MEQPRTRPQQHGPRRGGPPTPPQAARQGAQGRRPSARHPAGARRPAAAAPVSGPAAAIRRLRRLPNPRFTGLGAGLFCGTLMFLLGCLDQLLFGGSQTGYGVLFLPVCVLTAVWVRRGDLLTSPVVVPIGFAVGLLPLAEGDGFLGTLVSLVTALAAQALWLYGGTLIAGVTALLRRAAPAPARARAGRRPPR
ncbi:DUF6542 domain-containing protein [Streptomyces sp. MK5]|uniref:DUF6542 domain-containing protein n=1 Tax=Streptomyces sp. MK5 TaxID=3064253 RepID=UPI0027422115|nr:DUF6542 domain-containing protein [Streptomyces sp. MK5]